MFDDGTPTQSAEIALDIHAELGEGPVWHPSEHVLYWVDLMAGDVHRFDPASHEDTSISVGQPVGAVVPRMGGGMVLALRDGFGLLDSSGGAVRMIADTEADEPSNRMTDGKCDAIGRFWAGTLPLSEDSPAGTLYRLDRDGAVHAMVPGVTVSNGIDWSPDQKLMYYIDTPTRGVDVFDFDLDTCEIANRRRLITVQPEYGMPDGMTVDAEGYLWVAMWGGWAVRRYTPDGRLDRTISVEASQVTSVAFGGPDYTDLFITSAARGVSAAEAATQPHAGAIFVTQPGIKGLAPNLFGG
ncbi:MAG: putative Membrane Associated Protein [Chloroflexi bacterium]|nr:putative Membrane Associated Protein [Chloroflexota bacterium]